VNGIELARRLWADAVEPILSRRFPELDVAAALLGYGSEVLGFDDEVSQDHQWGPRLLLFVPERALHRTGEIGRTLAGLCAALGPAAVAHNELAVTAPVDPEPRAFHGRPFQVLDADRFVAALREAIEDPDVRRSKHDPGAIDAVSQNVDVVTRPHLWR